MSDPLRSDPARAADGAPDVDRDGKIEQLLLLGLDHYFAAEYDQAINVWTRALFLDRSHARARAYIERARTALAERLRRSEELLHDGVAAFHRGDGDEARRLLEAAMQHGAPPDQALAVLERLNRVEQIAVLAPASPGPRTGATRSGTAGPQGSGGRRALLGWLAAFGVVAAAAAIIAAPNFVEWVSALPQTARPPAAGPVAGDRTLPLPRRGETLMARARALAAGGRLHDALATLDQIRRTDAEYADATRLRGEIQRQLLAVSDRLP